jgi:hypothetical protein
VHCLMFMLLALVRSIGANRFGVCQSVSTIKLISVAPPRFSNSLSWHWNYTSNMVAGRSTCASVVVSAKFNSWIVILVSLIACGIRLLVPWHALPCSMASGYNT